MTILPNIYLINREHYLLKGAKEVSSIIKIILNAAVKAKKLSDPFEEEKVSMFQKDEFRYFLYVTNTNEKQSDWLKFFPTELTNNRNFTQQKVSLILFIETEYELYAIVGGSAFHIIIAYIDHSFGLNTYDRIIEPDRDELTSIKTRGITGQRIAMNEQFRNEYRISNFTRFGKLPKEIHVKLCRKTTDLYFPYLKNKVNDRIQITVGAGFKIGRQVDFEDLHRIIKDMALIATESPKNYLSSYKQILDEDEKNKLMKLLYKKLYNNLAFLYQNSKLPEDQFSFDFCNPNNIDKFYEADKYELKEKTPEGGYKPFAVLSEREEIFKTIMDKAVGAVGQNNQFDFIKYLWRIHIAAIKGDRTTTSSNFFYHFSAEFEYDDKAIFLIDTKWFYLKEQFIKDLIINTQHILKTYRAPNHILKFPWDKKEISREDKYNLLYNGEPNYIVCDKIFSDGIELCDILYYDDTKLYLIHVKAGFRAEVRELANQITISARRLKETLNSKNHLFLDTIYSRLSASENNLQNFSNIDFKALFKKEIIYILAINSTLTTDLPIEENMENYNSNIARFSLIQCSNEMYTNYYPLLTYQIPRA